MYMYINIRTDRKSAVFKCFCADNTLKHVCKILVISSVSDCQFHSVLLKMCVSLQRRQDFSLGNGPKSVKKIGLFAFRHSPSTPFHFSFTTAFAVALHTFWFR